jgi:hypothetical protein
MSAEAAKPAETKVETKTAETKPLSAPLNDGRYTGSPEIIHFGDKVVPGLQNSVTIRTKTKPEAKVLFWGTGGPLKFILTRLDAELWKVRFLLPKDAKGEVEVSVKAGSESGSLKKAITASV